MDKEFIWRSTRLDGTGKEGVLKPDSNGYYTICLGALEHTSLNVNPLTGKNEYYSSEGAEKFFDPSKGLLNTRIRGGHLKAEYGHPKRIPGMTDQDYMKRNLEIHEDRVCGQFGEIWLVPGYTDPLTGEKCIGIMGKIKPCGPFGDAFRKDLESPGINVCMSIRSLTTRKFINGRNCKVLHTIVTWDSVNEPGITCAEKLLTPGLESREVQLTNNIGLDVEVSLEDALMMRKDDQLVSHESTNLILNHVIHELEKYNSTISKKKSASSAFRF